MKTLPGILVLGDNSALCSTIRSALAGDVAEEIVQVKL